MSRAAAPLALLVLTLLVAGAPARGADRTAPAEDDYARGVRLLDEGEWTQALPLYQKITRENPTYPWGWLGLGWSLHHTGNPAAALPAYRRARQLGALDDHRLLLESSRCHLLLGHRDSAMTYLRLAIDAGMPNPVRLARDNQLTGLAADPEFVALLGLDTTGVTRAEGWRHDLRLLAREIGRIRVEPYRSLPAADLEREIARLSSAVESLDDDRMGAEVMKLVVRLGDGHTVAQPPFMAEGAPVLPLLFAQFDDGVFVTATDSARTELLWAEVLEVDGHPIAQVLDALEPFAPRDNPIRVKSVAPRYLRRPRLLHAIGLAASGDAVSLGVRDRSGRRRSLRVPVTRESGDWVRVPAGRALPLYAQRRTTYHWFEMLPDSTLYFQYNGVADADTETVAEFARKLLARLDRGDAARLVIDLRWNGGGNLMLNPPLLEAIIQARNVNRPGHLFVIASRHTFSAAMVFAGLLDRYTHAIFVGEPTGSSPNFIGESTTNVLPWSRIEVSLSNRAWQSTHAMDHRVWIPPRIPVAWTFASYREGRDPALEAIRKSVATGIATP